MKKILLLFFTVLFVGLGIKSEAQFVAPFLETFTAPANGAIPTGFTTYALSSRVWTLNINQTNAGACAYPGDHTGGTNNRMAILDQSSPGADSSCMEFDVDVAALTVPELRFWYYMCGGNNASYTMPNRTFVEVWDGTVWNTVLALTHATPNNTWEEHTVILSGMSYTGTITRVRFRAETNGIAGQFWFYGDNSIDDLEVREAPTCIKVTNPTATALSATTAEVAWTDNNTTAPANGWEIEFGAVGFPQTGTPNFFANTNPDTITGLQPSQNYEYYVRARCSATDSSFWVGPVAFSTPATCPAPTNLMTTAVTNNSVSFSWVGNGTDSAFGIEVQPTGSPSGGTPFFYTTASNYTQPVPQGQTFDFYVYSLCGGGDTSFATGPLTVTVCAPLAGNYTIDSTMATGGTNYQSFNEASAALLSCGISAPVVFNVNNAVNNEQVIFDEIVGASAANTITFEGNGNIIQDSATATGNYVVRLIRSDYFIFNNLHVLSNRTGTVSALHLTGHSSHNLFTNCTFEVSITSTNTLLAPFSYDGGTITTQKSGESDSNTVDSCTFIGGYYGYNFRATTGSNSNGNQILNSTFEDQRLYGIYMFNGDETTVSGNDISRATRTSLTTYYGIYHTGLSDNTLIEKNYIHDPAGSNPAFNFTGYFIYMLADAANAGVANVIQNNVINDNQGNGTHYGIFANNAYNVHIYHNTVSHNAVGSFTGITRGIYQAGTSTLLGVQDIQNNIVSITRTTSGQSFGIYNQYASSTIDYNNVHGSSSNFLFGFNGGNQVDLTAWQASTPTVGANSLDQNPLFASMATGDFQPTNGLIDNLGNALGVMDDITGATRPATGPDMGAYEFAVTCINPSNISASNITNNSLDLSWTENGSATLWQIEIVPAGTPNTGIADSTNVTSNVNFPITGLATFVANDFYVRSVCGAGDTSVWFGPFTVQACAPLAGNYTIDSTLPSGATNFHSFQEVAVALDCGISAPVVFSVDNAMNNEQVIFDEVIGASATNTITFEGNGNTIDAPSTTTSDRHTIRLEGADYFRFNNLTVSSSSTSNAFPMHLSMVSGSPNNNEFTNCTFQLPLGATSSTTCAFAVSASYTSATSSAGAGNTADSIMIDSCTFVGGYYGVNILAGFNAADFGMGNTVTNSEFVDQYGYGLYTLYQDDLLFENNEIHRDLRTNSTTFYAIYGSGGVNRAVISKNWIHNIFPFTSASTFYGTRFFMDGTSGNENLVVNNLIEDIDSDGDQYGIYLSTANHMQVYHNTVVLDDDSLSGAGDDTRGIWQAGTGSLGQDFRNNNLIITRNGVGNTHGIWLDASAANLTCDNNNVYLGDTATLPANAYYGENGGNQSDLAAWQASTPTVGQSSTQLDPMVTTPAPDYTPTNPLMNNLGFASGIMSDIVNSPRSGTNPDMGAFEFSTSAIDMQILSLTPDTSIGCYGMNDTVKVVITNAGSAMVDFTVNPATVTAELTGTVTATLTDTINTGTLAPFASLTVVLSPTVNLTANGSYAIDAYIATTGDTVTVNDTLPTHNYTVNVVAGTVDATPADICITGDVTLTLSGNAGGNIQWQESSTGMAPWTNIGTGANPELLTGVTATTYYRAVLTCNANMDSTAVDTVIVSNPMLASTTNDTICGPNSATLMATSSTPTGVVYWYDALTGGNNLGNGDTFATAVLSMTDTFYAEATDGGTGGLSHTTTYAAGNGSNGNMFPVKALTNLTIDSFAINANTGTSTFEVLYAPSDYQLTPGANTNAGFWTSLGTAMTTNVGPGSATVIPLNVGISIPAGQTYSFQVVSVSGATVSYTNGTAVGNLFNANADLEFYQGHGGGVNSMTFAPRVFNGDIFYSTGCAAVGRTPVYAVVNPSSGALTLTTSGNTTPSTAGTDSLDDMQLDGQTLSYYNPACELIATVEDAPGGNALGMVTSKVNIDSTVNVVNGQPYSRRWYDITPTNNGPAEVTLYFTQADFDDFNMHATIPGTYDSLPGSPTSSTASVRITKLAGGGIGVGTASIITPTSVMWDSTNMRWEVIFPVDSFSQFFLHTGANPNNPLPVALTDFTVVKNGSVSDAMWFTILEENNSHFNVQRSTDGRNFEFLGKVNSKSSNGYSTTRLGYNFTDVEPQIGHNYYRLEQIDLDGNKSYSEIIDLVWGADGSVVSIYPNPATDKLNIDVSIDKVAQLEVRLLDMSGRVVKSAVQKTAKGMNNVTLDLSTIAQGVYGVQILENNNVIHTSKISKQNK